jgi:O-antigen/teichoic acid export membrane protein
VTQPGFRKAGFIVLVGSAAGFGVSLLLTPFISRLYSPDVYGVFATVSAVVSVFVGMSTMRLEVYAQRTSDDGEASSLLRLALWGAIAWGVGLTLCSAVAVGLFRVSPWWLSMGPLVVIASLQLVGTAALTRTQRYRKLAFANFVQGASVGVTQLVLGWLNATVTSLLVGFGLGRIVWLGSVPRHHKRPAGLRAAWRRSRHFALMAGGSAGINQLASQLPILLSSGFFGNADVAFLAMAIRVLVSPLAIIGQAAAAANIGEVGRLLRERDVTVVRVVKHGMRDLFVVGVGPCLFAAGAGWFVVPILLGHQWGGAGVLVSLLSAGTLAQFTVSPFSQILNLTARNRSLLIWDSVRFLAILSSMLIPAVLGASFSVAIAVYSFSQVVIYTWLALACLGAVRSPH